MLDIEHLILNLPAGYATRGTAIAQLVAQGLAEINVASTSASSLQQLSLPPLHIGVQSSDQDIARRVVNAIHTQLSQKPQINGAQS